PHAIHPAGRNCAREFPRTRLTASEDTAMAGERKKRWPLSQPPRQQTSPRCSSTQVRSAGRKRGGVVGLLDGRALTHCLPRKNSRGVANLDRDIGGKRGPTKIFPPKVAVESTG